MIDRGEGMEILASVYICKHVGHVEVTSAQGAGWGLNGLS